jgi:methylase of polypeptide subunit release factors
LSGTYDLVISNPPYIPRPLARIDNPYEGLSLVARLAKRSKTILNPGGRILINLSSLAGEEPLAWFAEQGLNVQALETMRVPLKVNPVTSGLSESSRAWRDYLEKQGRVEIDVSEASGYRYWHFLRMFVITLDALP